MKGSLPDSGAWSDRLDAVFGRLDRLESALRTEIQAQTKRAEAAEAQLRSLGDLTARADELVAIAQSEAARLGQEARDEFDLAAQAHREAEELRAEAERLATKAATEHAAALQQLAAAQHAAAVHEAAVAQQADTWQGEAVSPQDADARQAAGYRLATSVPTEAALEPEPEALGEDALLAIRRYLTDMLTLEEVTVATAGTVDARAGRTPRLLLLRSERRSDDDKDQRQDDEQRADR